MSQALGRVRRPARRGRGRVTALFHHLAPGCSGRRPSRSEARRRPRRGPTRPGGPTRRTSIADRGAARSDPPGAYRAGPSRSGYIPKPTAGAPLAVAALEDKIVQRATVAVLNAIYEEDFLGFSVRLSPGAAQHDALDALASGSPARR